MKKLTIILLGVFFIVSCGKDENTKEAVLNIRLTDAPANYEAVNVEIENVQIHIGDNENEEGWHDVEIMNKGIYNLLDFNNGLDTLLASSYLPTGNASQIRLYLGENNTLVKDGQTHDLFTTSGIQSGLKLQIHQQLEEGITYSMWLDFDASRSIVETGSGKYNLKPVIRTFTEATSGSIKGIIEPGSISYYVQALNSNDTIGTISDINGYFLLKGIPEGFYEVIIQPRDTLISEKTITNVEVLLGQITDLDTVKIN
ncbi:MAG: DUF4382 domain-containing protein [Salinivirgaceae bacterium]|jgi:hypothetical protein|nr:DUF4382 domain-containing protein [Salinivirgaceae bacterium]